MSNHLESTSMRDLLCASLRKVTLARRSACGWVAKRREHGEHLAFLDVRDHSGIVQAGRGRVGRRAAASTSFA